MESGGQWKFQDPKLEKLHDVWPYFGGISPYVALFYMVGPSILGSWNSHWSDGFPHPSKFNWSKKPCFSGLQFCTQTLVLCFYVCFHEMSPFNGSFSSSLAGQYHNTTVSKDFESPIYGSQKIYGQISQVYIQTMVNALDLFQHHNFQIIGSFLVKPIFSWSISRVGGEHRLIVCSTDLLISKHLD